MSSQSPPTAPPTAPHASPRRRALRALLWTLAALGLLVAAGSALTAWLWQTTSGLTTVVAVLDRLLPARLTVAGAAGSFAQGFSVDELVYDAPTVTIRVQRLRAQLADAQFGLSLRALRFNLDELAADALTVRLRPADAPSTGLPASIASPVQVSARRLAIGAFELVTGAEASPTRIAARAIDTALTIGPDGYRMTDGRFAFGPLQSPLRAELSGTLAGAPPFAVDARGRLLGRLPGGNAQGAQDTLRSQPMSAALAADGSLVDLRVTAQVQPVAERAAGAAAPRGTLQARIASFEPPALRALVADLQDIDPADWVDGAPTARLALHAELVPQPGDVFTVSGPVRVSNAAPGPIDAQRLPLRAATAQVEASAAALRVTAIDAQLSRGSTRGSFQMDFARLDAWRAQAQFTGVDPATIHTRVRPLSLDGRADVVHDAGDTAVTGALRNRAGLPVEASVDLRASRQRLLVNTAQLKLGSGQAMRACELQFDGARAARLAGSVVEFDPSLLVAGVDARLTGTLNVDGVLAPQPAGTAAFGLAESQAFGRPLAGHGVLTLDAAGELQVDATLTARSATLTARGGLRGNVGGNVGGASGSTSGSTSGGSSGSTTGSTATVAASPSPATAERALTLSLSAPQLRELGLPVAGRLLANARLTGTWRAPAVDLQLEAGRLIWGEHRVEEMQAVATYSGGRDGTLALQATASNHRFQRNPTLSFASATLRADGRLGEHRIELRANNEEAQPLAAVLVGGWQPPAAEAPKKPAPRPAAKAAAAATPAPAAASARAEWRGELRSASAGRPLDLMLLAPAPIRTDFSRFSIGPIDMRLAGARVDEVRVEVIDGVLSTAGRFADFQPSALRGGSGSLIAPAVLQPGTITPGSGGENRSGPIALRGQWQLRLGTQADGTLLIERSGGDIEAAGTTMGISELRLEAALRANRLQASARMRGERAGRLDAQLAADVERSADGWRLAQQRPLSASLDADIPSIAWFNALLSEAVRGNVRLGGAVNARLKVDGTPADPSAQGTINGERLRVAWIDQGIRLENGTLAARVDGGSIVLDALRFAGGPQVRPGDRRPLDALAKDNGNEPGFLSMNGRLLLRDLSGVLQVQAVRVPFLQRADRWVVATGGANIVFDQKRVQLNGAVLANAGFVDFSRPNLPSLSNDVQVVGANAPGNGSGAARDAPIGLNFDLGIDLGPAFYLRGLGLDTRVDGQLRLRAEGRGAIRATGAVEARDGQYEGFGQRLAIERGRVNFQGPLENPGLDVLAVKRGLPVEVGVSITRTAQNPLIKLYSDQPMADFQILSWLVLGRPADETGAERNADRAALATAAAGLLSGSGEGITTQLARRLGIDEISLRSGDIGAVGSLLPRSSVAGSVRGTGSTAAGEIVTIGKRLSDNITVSYEQALATTGSLVQISYQLTRRLSVIARAGTENALDLVYSFAFD